MNERRIVHLQALLDRIIVVSNRDYRPLSTTNITDVVIVSHRQQLLTAQVMIPSRKKRLQEK